MNPEQAREELRLLLEDGLTLNAPDGAAVIVDALLAERDLVLAALGGELIAPMHVGMKRIGAEHDRYRFPALDSPETP